MDESDKKSNLIDPLLSIVIPHYKGFDVLDQCLKSIIGISDVKISQMAVNDFIRGYGSYEELCKTAGLSHGDVVKNAIKLLN